MDTEKTNDNQAGTSKNEDPTSTPPLEVVDSQQMYDKQDKIPPSEPEANTAQPDFRPPKSQESPPTTTIEPGLTPQEIYFPNKNKAQVLAPPPHTDIDTIQSALALEPANALLLVIGGSPDMDGVLESHLTQLFSRGVARIAATIKATIIDGGRNTGIMALVGQGVADRGYKSPLIGVAPASKITHLNGSVEGHEALEHHHSHFVLTDGAEWGAEIDMMYKLAGKLAENKPIVTILVGGDELAKNQAVQSVRSNWPLIIISDTGHLADELDNLWQERPDFIADPRLAEIISDGTLHFLSLENALNGMTRLLDQLSSQESDEDTSTIKLAWQSFGQYDANANRQQSIFNRLQKSILAFGVLGTTLAVAQSQLIIVGLESNIPAVGDYDILRIVIVTIPIIITLLMTTSNRFNAGTKWILTRASAETIKKEIYRYRTHTEIYSDSETKKLSREIKLARKLDRISSKIMQTEVNTSAMPPYTGAIPPLYGAADGDEGLDFMTPERYLKYRLQDQLTYYSKKTVQLEKELKWYQWLIYIGGAAGTLLAAFEFELWIAVSTALVTAFTSYLQYQKTEERLMRYNQTATDLDNIRRWWVSLSAQEQADPANLDKLVGQTETSVHSEHAAWIQDMQDAMSEVRAEQSGDEANKSNKSKSETAPAEQISDTGQSPPEADN